jgi:guanine deaminase
MILDSKRAQPERADILVSQGTIREIGVGLSVPEGVHRVSAEDRIVIPGLVNSHTHSQGNLAKAHGDRWTLELLLLSGPWMSANRSLEDKYLSAAIGAAEMIRRGCTACYDLFAEIPHVTADGLNAVGQAYADSGMRAVIAPMLADTTFYQAVPGLIDALEAVNGGWTRDVRLPSHSELIDICAAALKSWPFERDRIALNIAPTIPLLCSDDFLKACRKLADQFGVGIHTHMAESRVWARLGEMKYGQSLARHFDTMGLISPKFTAAHGVWLSDDDLKLMADKGASVAHNPLSNMRLGSGLADVPSMRRLGVNVGIGTDSCNCSDNLSMIESMRIASYTSRVIGYGVDDWLSTNEVFRMATTGSAAALGWQEQIGLLSPGFKADMVLLDRRDIGFVPLHNAVNQLVHCIDSTAVASVMIDGRLVYHAGQFVTMDYPALVRRAEEAAARLAEANRQLRDRILPLEAVTNAVCSGVGRQKTSRNNPGAA